MSQSPPVTHARVVRCLLAARRQKGGGERDGLFAVELRARCCMLDATPYASSARHSRALVGPSPACHPTPATKSLACPDLWHGRQIQRKRPLAAARCHAHDVAPSQKQKRPPPPRKAEIFRSASSQLTRVGMAYLFRLFCDYETLSSSSNRGQHWRRCCWLVPRDPLKTKID